MQKVWLGVVVILIGLGIYTLYGYLRLESPPIEEEIQDSKYVLRANVYNLTYVKIYVDDNPPQEYMFRPGRTPDWKGNRGFYIIVGNAAGIELNFNGKIIDDLGKEGKVKTVRLPEDFKSECEEESE